MRKKLKWWQWVLIVFLGTGVLNTIFGDPPPPPEPPQTKGFASPDAEFKHLGRDIVFAMTFDGQADPEALPDVAREHCGSRLSCQVLGWTDPKYAARAMPMTDREVSQVAFNYSLHRGSGLEVTQWDCNRWKRTDPTQCLTD